MWRSTDACSPERVEQHRTKQMKKLQKSKSVSAELKGWRDIATFLGQPTAVAQRWARSEGMPTERRGRYVYASREKLNQWLGRESSVGPVQISAEDTDLGAELRRGLALVRKKSVGKRRQRSAAGGPQPNAD